MDGDLFFSLDSVRRSVGVVRLWIDPFGLHDDPLDPHATVLLGADPEISLDDHRMGAPRAMEDFVRSANL